MDSNKKTPEQAMEELKKKLKKAFPGGFLNGTVAAAPTGEPFLNFEHNGVQFRLVLFDENYFALYGWKTANADTIWVRVSADEPNLSDKIWLNINAYLSR